eukprot:5458864-Pleurochrysis_carterae.AAC.1
MGNSGWDHAEKETDEGKARERESERGRERFGKKESVREDAKNACERRREQRIGENGEEG